MCATLRQTAARVAYLTPDFHYPTGALVPEADRRRFSTWVSNMLTPENPRQIKEAVENIHAFLLDLVVEDQRRDPEQRVVSAPVAKARLQVDHENQVESQARVRQQRRERRI